MTPEANDALHRIEADYPSVKWTQDGPDTVILYFEHIRAYVFLCSDAMSLDEARTRAELDALLAVTTVTPVEELEPVVVLEGEPMTGKSFVIPAPEESPPEPVPASDPEPAPLPPEV
jgi:hypothetical protein